MGKDSALGHDPLRWMKITKENNKSLSPEDASAKGRNAETIEQQPGIQSAPKQQIPIPSGNGEVRLVSKKVTPSPGSGDMPGNPAATKPKVVIGRLYEKPSPEKAKSVQRNENEIQETRRSVEPSLPASRTIQPIKRMETEINRIPVSAAASNFSMYIIVAYTALLLILGYFVYSDLSKRTSRIEAKILAIEKTLREK
ncbi:MAG: hypothetical protein Q6358_10840 [Candidatus Brocadiales bacterium]|uniref:hypothetical protein n=1 Tax=Candidatus Wunengus sp. YC60 TaxID=3367697 RepID=UPI0027141098|nr:hypothetical protein [Candidatus Brocadiales bacterium]